MSRNMRTSKSGSKRVAKILCNKVDFTGLSRRETDLFLSYHSV